MFMVHWYSLYYFTLMHLSHTIVGHFIKNIQQMQITLADLHLFLKFECVGKSYATINLTRTLILKGSKPS